MDRVGLVPVTLAAFGAGLYAIHHFRRHGGTPLHLLGPIFCTKMDQIKDLFSPPETFFLIPLWCA